MLGAMGILTSLFFATSANAQALKAKKVMVDLVAAYNQCTTPTLTHRPSLALPSCVPALATANNPANVYTFGPRGKWKVQAKRIPGDIQFKTGEDLEATANLRATDNGCGALMDVDCTIVDFPFPVPITCLDGRCASALPTANGVLANAIHEGDIANIEIGQIAIVDEDGDNAFKMGLLVP
jgi:hypothetical protein